MEQTDQQILDKREKDIEEILASSGVTPEQSESIKQKIKSSSVYKCKSDALFKYSLMIQLMFDYYDKDLDILFVIADPSTGETADFMHACKFQDNEPKTIDQLIRNVNRACQGSRIENGDRVASSLMTIIANVVAMYCAKSDAQYESFKSSVEHWQKIWHEAEKTSGPTE